MRFERLASRAAIAVTVGCLAVMAVTVVALASPSVRTSLGFAAPNPPSYVAGQHVELPSPAYESARYTLVLFARSDCPACRRAQPFLKTLAAGVAAMPGLQFKVAMHAGSGPARADTMTYFSGLGLSPAELIDIDLGIAKINRVPALVLVDRQGTVQFDWESPLPDQDSILRVLGSVSAIR